jgi:hypothetical protein
MMRAAIELLLDELSGGRAWIFDRGLSLLLDATVVADETSA